MKKCKKCEHESSNDWNYCKCCGNNSFYEKEKKKAVHIKKVKKQSFGCAFIVMFIIIIFVIVLVICFLKNDLSKLSNGLESCTNAFKFYN